MTPHRRFQPRASCLVKAVVFAGACCVLPTTLVLTTSAQTAELTEAEFAKLAEMSLQPWTDDNEQMQIIRRPAPGQHVNFPPKDN